MISPIPQGRWAVAVSGGADSVCLLHLLHEQSTLHLHVAHLDHQTRNGESALDAAFVKELADSLDLDSTIARRDEIEPGLQDLPSNLPARFRAIRYKLFEDVVRLHNLQGVIIAHHADDQAETILHRLLRGSSLPSLSGMNECSTRNNLTILRPLLHARRSQIENYLRERNIRWREDSSNVLDAYARNRLRKVLRDQEDLHQALINLGEVCSAWNIWLDENAPDLGDAFSTKQLADLAQPLAQRAAWHWLRARGASGDDLSSDVVDRLIEMTTDAASPPRQHFPGNLLVQRKAGKISASSSSR